MKFFLLILLSFSGQAFGQDCKSIFAGSGRTPSALVIGAGSFGLSFSEVLAPQFKEVFVFGRNQNDIRNIQENRRSEKLKPVFLSHKIQAHTNWTAFLNSKIDVLVLALPFNQIANFLSENHSHFLEVFKNNKDINILSLSKGLSVSPEGKILFIEDLFRSEFGSAFKTYQIYVLSGPSFALELAQKKKTRVSLAGFDRKKLDRLKQMIETDYLDIKTNQDRKGTAYAGAVKNIMVLLAGMTKGLDLAQNSQTSLILKLNEELLGIGKTLGVKTETYLEPAYFGDIILSLSHTSRNSHLGFMLGQGNSLKKILEQKPESNIEGVNTIKEIYKWTKDRKSEYPLINTLYLILYENKPAQLLLDV